MTELEKRISGAPSKGITPLMFEYELIKPGKIREAAYCTCLKAWMNAFYEQRKSFSFAAWQISRLLGNPDDIGHKINTLGLSLERGGYH